MSEKLRIAVYNTISARGLERFPHSAYEVGKGLARPDAILLRSHPLQLSEIPGTVKAIGRAGAGVNNIPVEEMSRRGVPVFNAPGANANAVKELVIAAMLLAARNVVPAVSYVQSLAASGDFDKRVEDGKKQFAGFELPGRTLGVIGLGAIGGLVADSAIRLGMKALGYDPEITVDNAWRLPASVKRAASIEEVLKGSDFVTLHVPLNAKTRHLIGRERLAHARRGLVLLNFSRDAVVDEEAVLASIAEKRLRAYVCDFPSPRLQNQAGVVALPHLGASTEEAEENCALMVAEEVREFLEEGAIRNAVNFPSVEMARESPHRIAIANANVPNMVGQISTTMAQAGLNIHNMVNKSKGEMAYTLVDLDSAAAPEVVARIARIPGVLSIRSIAPLERPAP
ncbi:MAG TPA: phosphoglycerate dehydrogenase [Usitatibacter sp.]|nr:phosphoglycerate dehydrogenase [Usitatibacter sp.]